MQRSSHVTVGDIKTAEPAMLSRAFKVSEAKSRSIESLRRCFRDDYVGGSVGRLISRISVRYDE